MAENRFAKGVKTAKERTAEIEASKNNQDITETTPDKKVENATEVTGKNKIDISKIFADTPKKRNAVAKTFYMNESNMDKLEKLAKAQKMSVSKVLNEILSNVL